MKTSIQTFLKDETGVTAIEYGLIAGLLVAVIAATMTSIGQDLNNIFLKIKATLDAAAL